MTAPTYDLARRIVAEMTVPDCNDEVTTKAAAMRTDPGTR